MLEPQGSRGTAAGSLGIAKPSEAQNRQNLQRHSHDVLLLLGRCRARDAAARDGSHGHDCQP